MLYLRCYADIHRWDSPIIFLEKASSGLQRSLFFKGWVEFRNFVKLPTPGVWEQKILSSLTKFSISSPVNVLFRSDFSFDGSLSLIFIFPENHFYPVFPTWATECKVSFVFLPTSCLYVTCFHMASFHVKWYILVVTNYSTSFLGFFFKYNNHDILLPPWWISLIFSSWVTRQFAMSGYYGECFCTESLFCIFRIISLG